MKTRHPEPVEQAMQYLEQNQVEEALATLARFDLGLVLSDLGRLDEARTVFQAAVEADPAGGETMLGFNCDACGALHTWVLGIVPPGDS